MLWLKKIKGEKHIASLDFAEHLKKSDVLETSKVYYSRYLRNGLYERYCYNISKTRWDIRYHEKSASPGYWYRDEAEIG